MAAFLDLCRFTASAGGTSDWTYSSTVSPYLSPTDAGAANGRVYKLRAESADLTQWEVSEGAYSSTGAGSFARTNVLYNSAGSGTKQSGAGTKINFSAAPQVWVVASKLDLLSVEEANSFSATQKAQARANIDALKKNYVVNGAMMVSQENGASAGTATNYYAADQFLLGVNSSGTVSVQQVAGATPCGSPNRIGATVTGADASIGASEYVVFRQHVEGLRVVDLKLGSTAAKTVTIQFGCKGPAGTYSVGLRNPGAYDRSYVAEYIISGGEANTDVVKSVTIALDQSGTWATDNTSGLEITWCLAAGSSFQGAAGAWGNGAVFASSNQFNFMGTNGNVFELFDVGLYEGAAAPTFQVPDYQAELLLCQRYYQAIKMTGGSGQALFAGMAYNSTLALFPWYFHPPMRATPSMSAGSASNWQIRYPSGATVPSAFSFASGLTSSRVGATTSSVLTPGQGLLLEAANVNAVLSANARL